MKNASAFTAFTLCAAAILLAACGSTASKSSYPVTHTGAVQKMEKGTVVGTRNVKIDGRATNMGRIVGGAVGAGVGALSVPIKSETTITQSGPNSVAIRSTDNRHESHAATAIGGAVGMVVGQKVEKVLTAKKAQEITVALDSGETVVIIQEYREPEFYDQERVKVYTTRAGEAVVYHSDENPHLDPETSAYIVGDPEEEAAEDFEPVVW